MRPPAGPRSKRSPWQSGERKAFLPCRRRDDGAKSTVEWKGAFYRGYANNDPPPELSDEAAVKAVAGAYKAGLANLKKTLEAGG